MLFIKSNDIKREKEQQILNEKVSLVQEQTPREMEIEHLIREKYSLSQEIAILRKIHLGKITEDEFKEYSDYIEECINKVEEEVQPEEK